MNICHCCQKHCKVWEYLKANLDIKPYCALCNHRNGTEVRLGQKRVSNTSLLPFLAGNQAKECFIVIGSSYQTRAGFLKSNKVVSLGSDPVQGCSSNKFSLWRIANVFSANSQKRQVFLHKVLRQVCVRFSVCVVSEPPQ